jgi:hypothetical protein
MWHMDESICQKIFMYSKEYKIRVDRWDGGFSKIDLPLTNKLSPRLVTRAKSKLYMKLHSWLASWITKA